MTSAMVLLGLLLACGDKDGGDDGNTDDTGTSDGGTGGTDADADGWSTPEDCDDNNAAVNPDATEVCNDRDDDCDLLIDDDDDSLDSSTQDSFYTDADGDGYGADHLQVMACSQPDGTAIEGGDCDDASAAENPGATEICDGLDNDCDGLTDDEDDDLDTATASIVYVDADGDGFGTDESKALACDAGKGTASKGGDCDDGDDAVFPGADELCDGADNDCDATTTEDGKITVAGANFTNLSAALAAAGDDDTVYVCAGSYTGPFTTSGKTSIVGLAGASSTTLTASRGNAILTAGGDLSVSGLTFSNGVGTYTGAIDAFTAGTALTIDVDSCVFNNNSGAFGGAILAYNDSTLNITDSTFTSNSASTTGGAIYMQQGEISGSTFSGNSATFGGALMVDSGDVTVDRDTMFSGNAAEPDATGAGGYGGAVLVQLGSLTAGTTTEFSSNEAVFGGGVLVLSGEDAEGTFKTASLFGGQYTGNSASASGGGILLAGEYATAADVVVSSNTATWGGGVAMESTGCELSSAEIYDNVAESYGGGLLFAVAGEEDIMVSDAFIDNNSAPYGGAVANEGAEVTFVECEISNNTADDYGGGFYIYSASVTLDGGQVTGNSAGTGDGGGVWMWLSELVSLAVDWGTEAAGDDNSPDDVWIEVGDTGDTGVSYDAFGRGETFSCDEDSCE